MPANSRWNLIRALKGLMFPCSSYPYITRTQTTQYILSSKQNKMPGIIAYSCHCVIHTPYLLWQLNQKVKPYMFYTFNSNV